MSFVQAFLGPSAYSWGFAVDEEPERRFKVGEDVIVKFEEFLQSKKEADADKSTGFSSSKKKSQAEWDSEMWTIINEENDVNASTVDSSGEGKVVSTTVSEIGIENNDYGGDHVKSDVEYEEERILRVRKEFERNVDARVDGRVASHARLQEPPGDGLLAICAREGERVVPVLAL